MTTRTVGGQTFNLSYDGENWLVAVSGAATASFVYNGDGQRVKSTVGGVTTISVGNYYEWHGSVSTSVSYYYAGSSRVAMKKGSGSTYFLLGDHLGSTSLVVDGGGQQQTGSPQGYLPWGETRFGSVGTKYQYTGQYNETSLGLYYYGARWYDASLGRFISPDILIPNPDNPQAWDRYSYVSNSPVLFADPTGNKPCETASLDDDCGSISMADIVKANYVDKILEKSGTIIVGNIWNVTQLAIIYHAILSIIHGVDRITGGYGSQWVLKNLGGTVIKLGGTICRWWNTSWVSGSTIHLDENFENLKWGNAIYYSAHNMIIHEFGHVLDNRMQSPKSLDATWIGNGPSDALLKFIGGYSTALFRWQNGLSFTQATQFGKEQGFLYGNNSGADYFAHSFAAAIVAPNNPNAPWVAVTWVSLYIDLTK